MAFSNYILECLRQHGKAELGPLGTFTLDYTPAKWKIENQNFIPPNAKIAWKENTPEQMNNYAAMAQVVAAKHDINFEKAYEFVESTISGISINHPATYSLGILGKLNKLPDQSYYSSFSMNEDFNKKLTVKPLSLPQIYSRGDEPGFDWWWLIGSFLLLTALFLVLGFFSSQKTPGVAITEIKNAVPELSSSTVKQTNISPSLNADTNALDSTSIKNTAIEIIVITGSYCKQRNIKKAKALINNSGYDLYDEKINAECARIGIKLISSENPELILQKIRNTIEPTAWLLDKKL